MVSRSLPSLWCGLVWLTEVYSSCGGFSICVPDGVSRGSSVYSDVWLLYAAYWCLGYVLLASYVALEFLGFKENKLCMARSPFSTTAHFLRKAPLID
ncbi:hypothetical protein KC19_2G180900 [Ceratodon purpureus]|uniref:Uncharacterized protein n=1 Tax=Ceratodon purpureus TaxID=3225 RepID=A0A8T0IZ52_CERPU|nr:hypothetical protein KC19_2G180900 [Ceratodon purpureus]